LPPLEENPVSLEMIEAANKVGVDFILNVVTNSKKEIVKIVAGDLEEAWYTGTKVSASMYHVPLKKKADVAIVSPGGYPRDINVYQAQKALDHADHGTKPGGTIIVLAECKEGLAEEVFSRWMHVAVKPEDNIERIKKGFVIGGHKAFAVSKVAANKEIILISSLDKETTETLFARKMDTIQEALSYVEEKYNDEYDAIIMPQGSLTVPYIK
jgi:nickel-dependent lactate racemase